mmetsp:Transcript_13057/g.40719  ORF Transcript_13057/g.40719 Transcript_13057/m.40719 type:complete len:456 (+) Transcript_13057:438-1805(+)
MNWPCGGQQARLIYEGQQRHPLPREALSIHVHLELGRVEVDDGAGRLAHELTVGLGQAVARCGGQHTHELVEGAEGLAHVERDVQLATVGQVGCEGRIVKREVPRPAHTALVVVLERPAEALDVRAHHIGAHRGVVELDAIVALLPPLLAQPDLVSVHLVDVVRPVLDLLREALLELALRLGVKLLLTRHARCGGRRRLDEHGVHVSVALGRRLAIISGHALFLLQRLGHFALALALAFARLGGAHESAHLLLDLGLAGATLMRLNLGLLGAGLRLLFGADLRATLLLQRRCAPHGVAQLVGSALVLRGRRRGGCVGQVGGRRHHRGRWHSRHGTWRHATRQHPRRHARGAREAVRLELIGPAAARARDERSGRRDGHVTQVRLIALPLAPPPFALAVLNARALAKNGVFMLSDDRHELCNTRQVRLARVAQIATQLGQRLLVGGHEQVDGTLAD